MKVPLNPLFNVIALALAWGISPASAAPLASADFTDNSPGLITNQTGGTGWSGGYGVNTNEGFLNGVRTSNDAPLSYPNYPGVGGNYANVAAGYGFAVYNWIQRTVDVAGAFSAYYDGARVGADGTTLWGSFVYHNNFGMQFILQGADSGC